MQLLLASHTKEIHMKEVHTKEVDIESLVLQIVNSDRLRELIASNRVDHKALAREIVGGDEMKSWLAANRKDVDIELLTVDVLGSPQMQQLLRDNRKEADVELIASQVVASGMLREWLAAERKEADVEGMVARAVGEREGERERRSLEEGERWKMQLQAELERKDALLAEQNAALALLSGELSRVKDQVSSLGARLSEGVGARSKHAAAAAVAAQRDARSEAVVRAHHDAVLRRELRGLEGQLRLLREHHARLAHSMRQCCDKPPPALPLVEIERHVTRFLAGVFGQSGGGGGEADEGELRAWIGSVFVARKDLEARLANLTAASKLELREASERSADTIMASISDRISEQFVLQHQRQVAAAAAAHSAGDHVVTGTVVDGSAGLSGDQVRAIVNEALSKYDADKTGMVDYALESSGGQVISTRCSETYYEHSATLTLFGIPLWHKSNNPRSIIQPGVHPGECWAFRGSRGFAVIQLVGPVRISAFTVEHIPRALAFAGNIDSAPKDFTVLGLTKQNDPEPTLLGKYVYQQNGTSLQHFIVQRTDLPPFKLIELQIESNHGNMAYTCLYRFRVHGTYIPE